MEHLPLLLGLLVLGLIIFGPKKMIEMAGRLGQMLRELQAAVKEMNWSVLGEDAPSNATPSTLSKLSQFAQNLTAPVTTPPAPPSPDAVVEQPAAEEAAPTEQAPAAASDAPGEA